MGRAPAPKPDALNGNIGHHGQVRALCCGVQKRNCTRAAQALPRGNEIGASAVALHHRIARYRHLHLPAHFGEPVL